MPRVLETSTVRFGSQTGIRAPGWWVYTLVAAEKRGFADEQLGTKICVESARTGHTERQIGSSGSLEALSRADPELAAEILQVFSDVEAAADWATSELDDFEGSPAQQAAEGRTPEVLARLRKAVHGFPG